MSLKSVAAVLLYFAIALTPALGTVHANGDWWPAPSSENASDRAMPPRDHADRAVRSSSARHLELAQQRPTAHDVQHLHSDPAAYIGMLEDPKRDAWQQPEQIIGALGIRQGQSAADIGAGSGYFALRLAHAVGTAGSVRAVDISPDMLRHLETRAHEAGLTNLQVILARPDDPLLPPSSVDLVFICDTWHHIEDRPRYLTTLRRALKPGARVAIVDFYERELPVGPPTSMKLSRDRVVAEFAGAGFRLAEEHRFLAYQYFLVFTPQ